MKEYVKRLLLLVGLLVCLMGTAAATSVEYQGEDEGIIVISENQDDLFDNFKNVMPGDTRTEDIMVENTATDSDYIRMYMRALPVDEENVEMLQFLSEMFLTVYQEGEQIYAASPDETADLTEWHYLGKIVSGDAVALEAVLEVPLTMGNPYQLMSGDVIWEFQVNAFEYDRDKDDDEDEEIPIDPIDPTIPTNPDDPTVIIPHNPLPDDGDPVLDLDDPTLIQTGQQQAGIWALLAGGLVLIGLGIFLLRRGKRHD